MRKLSPIALRKSSSYLAITCPEHLEELTLLIEAGLDAALLEKPEEVADQLSNIAHSIRNNAASTTPD